MHAKVIFVESLVVDGVLAKGHVTHDHVKKAWGQPSVFKALDADIGALVELAGEASSQTVVFNARECRSLTHRRGHDPKEIPHAHGRLKHPAACKPELFQRLINTLDDFHRGVVGIGSRTARQAIFFWPEEGFHFSIFVTPLAPVLTLWVKDLW